MTEPEEFESTTHHDDVAAWLRSVLYAEGGSRCASDGPPAVKYRAIRGRKQLKLLIPSRPRRAARHAASAYWRLRGRRGLALAAIGAGIGVLGPRILPRQIEVRTGAGVDVDDPQASLLAHLGDVLGERALLTSVVVVSPDHRSPKLLMYLLRPSGDVVGFAKVGWNEHTRAMVRHEAAVLALVGDAQSSLITAPRVLYAGRWHDREILVARPLPTAIRPVGGDVDPVELAREVPRLDSQRRCIVAESPYWHQLVADLDELRTVATSDLVPLVEAAQALTTTVADRYGDVELEWGRWHGDWKDANMGIADNRLWVWDWEQSDPDVPVGLDVLQREYQIGRQRGDAPATSFANGARRLQSWLPTANRSRDRATMATVGLHRLQMMRTGVVWSMRTDGRLRMDPDVMLDLPDIA